MRILIVEDQEKLAKSLKKGLEHEGYSVDYLLDGGAAQRRVEAKPHDYDAIILDLMLPTIDGLSICKAWRDNKIDTPILILTAKDTITDKVKGLDSGADDYLVKPFGFEELLARLRALLRRPKETLPLELKAGNLRLNTNTKQVFVGNTELILTMKEISLLEYLMRNRNQIITREQILEHVWDYNHDSLANVVDVHIKNLRKKLSPLKHEQFLETVRGMGYRLKT